MAKKTPTPKTVSGTFTHDEVINLAKRILKRRFRRGIALTSPEATKDFVQMELAEQEQEVFACIFLDNRHRVIQFEKLFYGTLSGSSVHPREVVKRALELNAGAVIFAHNHPSGVAEPSTADRSITRQLEDALKLIEVRILDHIVVGAEGVVSFAERGFL
jgi:DNA repair protein RadC